MIITICSSVDFTPKIIEVKKELEDMGHKINILYFTQMIINRELFYEDYLKIKEKGEDILLRNKQPVDKSYIGGNTLIEMGFAYCHNKKIYLFNSIPERSEKMYYVDEIIDMKPIVINSDLTKIPTAI